MSGHHGPSFGFDTASNFSILTQVQSNCTSSNDSSHPGGVLDDKAIAGLATSLLVGYLINWGLLGLLTAQVYTYYMGFPNDRKRLKLFVYGLYLVELAQTVMATHDAIAIYSQGLMNSKDMMEVMMIGLKGMNSSTQAGNDVGGGAEHVVSSVCGLMTTKHLTINDVHLLWLTVPVIAGIVGLTGQVFFACRIYVLSDSMLLGGLIVFLGSLATAAALICGASMLAMQKIMKGISNPLFLVSCGLWNGFAALCDVIIAICMTYYLSRRDSKMTETQILLKKLKKLTIETGAITATTAILNVVLYVGFRSKPEVAVYFVIPAAAIAKLYSISILSNLNSRLLFTGGRYSMATGISPIDNASQYNSGDRLLLSRGTISIEPQSAAAVTINRHTITWSDAGNFVRNSAASEKRKSSIRKERQSQRSSRKLATDV